MRRYILISKDGTVTLDATELLGVNCSHKLAIDCTYSAAKLREIFHKPAKELGDPKSRWMFAVEDKS